MDQQLSFKEGSPPPESEKASFPFLPFFSFVTDCMKPLIPAFLGSGMVKVLTNLLLFAGLLAEDDPTLGILEIIGQAFYYFLPILLAASVAKRVGADPTLAMVIGGILLHPALSALTLTQSASFFGLPIISYDYAYSILPILFTIPLMKHLEDLAEKLSPPLIKTFLKPMAVLLMTAPIALLLTGPLSGAMGELLAQLIKRLYDGVGWLTLALLSALMPFIIMAGLRSFLLPLISLSLVRFGYDPLILVALFISSLSQVGASFAAAIRSHHKRERETALGAGLSAALAGVTEPSLFGVTMRQKRVLFVTCLSAFLAGLYAGRVGLAVYSSGGTASLFTLVQMTKEGDLSNLTHGIITLAITFLLSFTLTLILYRETKSCKNKGDSMYFNEQKEPQTAPAANRVAVKTITLKSPLSGTVIPLKEVKDETFAEGYLGEGCAVIPSDGHVYSPADGKVVSLFDTHHAVTILSKDGAEILIHVGRDTVTLGGRYFKAFCENGDEVKTGDLLLSFDLDAIEKEGFDTTTPMVITNNTLYQKIETVETEAITAGDPLLTLTDDGKKLG